MTGVPVRRGTFGHRHGGRWLRGGGRDFESSEFFVEEDLDEIGRFQAERLIEEMIKLVGPFAYNQAIGDARKLVIEKLSNIEEDLYVLEKNEGK